MKNNQTMGLLLMLLLITLVALIVVFNSINRFGVQSNLEQHKNNIALISHSLEEYHKERGIYPDGLDDLVPTYVESIPEYSEGDQTYSYSYFNTLNGTHYQLGFWLFDKTIFGVDKRGCIYYNSDPGEASCTAKGFLPETEKINI